jgi:hypothetical protein
MTVLLAQHAASQPSVHQVEPGKKHAMRPCTELKRPNAISTKHVQQGANHPAESTTHIFATHCIMKAVQGTGTASD